jgi:hypothetical protein
MNLNKYCAFGFKTKNYYYCHTLTRFQLELLFNKVALPNCPLLSLPSRLARSLQ